MAHILPHHNPTKLAMTVGWLSQILEGRYFMGIGAGAYPLASYMHGIKEEDQHTEHLNDLVRESPRSEEHPSELQSLMPNPYARFCLTEKNDKTNKATIINNTHRAQ